MGKGCLIGFIASIIFISFAVLLGVTGESINALFASGLGLMVALGLVYFVISIFKDIFKG